MTFTPSPQQAAAIRAIVGWYRTPNRRQQVFRLFGYAGSGKSTITLHAIAPATATLLPGNLRSAVKAGPIDGDSWCLLVNGNAAAAKLRQLLPTLQAGLQRQGWRVSSIRLKILVGRR